jgi:hypothetical protein
MFKALFQSPWAGAVGVLVSVLWEAALLIGPPLGLNGKDIKTYQVWGLVALAICWVQQFGLLIRENRRLKDRAFTFLATTSATSQTSGEGLPALFHRIGIRNDSLDVAEDCELIISSMPIIVDGLTKDTALQVKDSNDRITDIKRKATKHFDLFMTYTVDNGGNRPRRSYVLAPNMPGFSSHANKEFGDVVLTLSGKQFDQKSWTLRIVVEGGVVELGSIVPMPPT